jgi:hypothetical protein
MILMPLLLPFWAAFFLPPATERGQRSAGWQGTGWQGAVGTGGLQVQVLSRWCRGGKGVRGVMWCPTAALLAPPLAACFLAGLARVTFTVDDCTQHTHERPSATSPGLRLPPARGLAGGVGCTFSPRLLFAACCRLACAFPFCSVTRFALPLGAGLPCLAVCRAPPFLPPPVPARARTCQGGVRCAVGNATNGSAPALAMVIFTCMAQHAHLPGQTLQATR